MMFGKDAQWYLQNRAAIAAFKNYTIVVETDILPTQIRDLVKSAAEQAISELQSDGDDWHTHPDSDAYGLSFGWYVDGSFSLDTEIGSFIYVWVPKNVGWLGSQGGSPLAVTLLSAGANKSKTKELGQLVDAGVKSLPPKMGLRPKTIDEDGNYCSVKRFLDDVINENTLVTPQLEADLAKLFKEFSVAMLPGLKAVKNHLSKF